MTQVPEEDTVTCCAEAVDQAALGLPGEDAEDRGVLYEGGVQDLPAFFAWWDANYADRGRAMLAREWFTRSGDRVLLMAFVLCQRIADLANIPPDNVSADLLEMLMLREWAVFEVYAQLVQAGIIPRRGCANASMDTKRRKRTRAEEDEEAGPDSWQFLTELFVRTYVS